MSQAGEVELGFHFALVYYVR